MSEYMLVGSMELPERFEICFDRSVPIYRAGENVSGRLIMQVKNTYSIRTLHIVLKGEAHVEWEEKSASKKSSSTSTVINDTIEVVNLKKIIIGLKGADIVSNEITAGNHEFPFTFTLPTTKLPTSFEGDYGFVRYWLKVVMDRPWMSKPSCKRCFTVIESKEYDVNKLAGKCSDKLEINVSSFLCKSDPVSLEASTDKQGYCPGEVLTICLECKNYSRKKFSETRATLIQRIRFCTHGQTLTRMTDNPLTHKRGDPPDPRGTLRWINEEMKIPSIPMTTSCECLIQISYFLKVTLQGDRTGKEPTLQLYLPIIVMDSLCQDQPRKTPRNSSVHSNITLPGTPEMNEECFVFTKNTNLSQEQFEPSMMGGSDVRDDRDDKYIMGEMIFTPMYPHASID
ncbi:arrestin domain-containing protein 3-like [Glandiceps talaboti]